MYMCVYVGPSLFLCSVLTVSLSTNTCIPHGPMVYNVMLNFWYPEAGILQVTVAFHVVQTLSCCNCGIYTYNV